MTYTDMRLHLLDKLIFIMDTDKRKNNNKTLCIRFQGLRYFFEKYIQLVTAAALIHNTVYDPMTYENFDEA